MAADDPLYMLTEADRTILRRAVEIADRLRGNPALRPHVEEPDLQSPDVYIALTPAGGIPAMSGAGTGSEDPGSAECEVYRISTGPGTSPSPLVVDAFFTRTVWNLSASAITGNTWVTTVRDKWGSWLAVPVGSGAAGAQHNPVTRTYTISGTWTKPAKLDYIEVECIGGGGGGGAADTHSGVGPPFVVADCGGGGGGGGWAFVTIPAASLSATQSYTVGSGGTGSAASSNTTPAGFGGATSFGSFCAATGGTGGFSTPYDSGFAVQDGYIGVGGDTGVGTSGDLLGGGSAGQHGMRAFSITRSGAGGSLSPYGAGGRGLDANSVLNSNGINGVGHGAGGGGALMTSVGAVYTGGNGAGGLIIVREYYTS